MAENKDPQRRPVLIDRINNRFLADQVIGSAGQVISLVPGMFASAPANTILGNYGAGGGLAYLTADQQIELINTASTQAISAARIVAGSIAGRGVLQLEDSPSSSSTTKAATANAVRKAAAESSPPGAVLFFAGASAPDGWLKADGSLVNRTTYAALFAAIGALYGAGDGSTTFALPDLRGEFLRGWDDGRGVDSGRAMGTAQSHAFQNHQHFYQKESSRSVASGGDATVANVSTMLASTQSTTGDTASETRPRNIALLACIKY